MRASVFGDAALGHNGASGAVWLEDRSAGARYGIKGPQAAAWLADQGLPLPPHPNSWCAWDAGLVARLGSTEFLLEGAASVALPRSDLPPGVYPVLRRDARLTLAGPLLSQLLAQVCSFDFSAMPDDALAMTQMIGVSVTALWEQPGAALSLWCDPTFARYFWQTLAQVAGETASDTFASSRGSPR